MGVRQDTIEIEDVMTGSFSMAMNLRLRLSNFRWCCVVVYGPVKDELSEVFLRELNDICEKNMLPIVFCGNFNLIREAKDKNSNNIDKRVIYSFNSVIEQWQLREIKRCGPRFKWSNKQECLVMVNLYRILVSVGWELKNPLAHAWSLTRMGSDIWHNCITRSRQFMRGYDIRKRGE